MIAPGAEVTHLARKNFLDRLVYLTLELSEFSCIRKPEIARNGHELFQ